MPPGSFPGGIFYVPDTGRLRPRAKKNTDTSPFSPPSAPSQRRLQSPPAKRKFLGVNPDQFLCLQLKGGDEEISMADTGSKFRHKTKVF